MSDLTNPADPQQQPVEDTRTLEERRALLEQLRWSNIGTEVNPPLEVHWERLNQSWTRTKTVIVKTTPCYLVDSSNKRIPKRDPGVGVTAADLDFITLQRSHARVQARLRQADNEVTQFIKACDDFLRDYMPVGSTPAEFFQTFADGGLPAFYTEYANIRLIVPSRELPPEAEAPGPTSSEA